MISKERLAEFDERIRSNSPGDEFSTEEVAELIAEVRRLYALPTVTSVSISAEQLHATEEEIKKEQAQGAAAMKERIYQALHDHPGFSDPCGDGRLHISDVLETVQEIK